MTQSVTIASLIERYDALLLDAFGVLLDASGSLLGASALIHHLERSCKPYRIVTNDASRLPEFAAQRYAQLGLPIPAAKIITSGSLLRGYFAEHRLGGARCLVLGPPDSVTYTAMAGGDVLLWNQDFSDDAVDVIVIGDDEGYPFLPTLERVVSLLLRRLDAAKPVRLVLPNPDVIYPRGGGEIGITGGGVALLIEGALAVRYPSHPAARFDRLGKPYAPMFATATAQLETRHVVMIGDQLGTDIRGALDFGIDAALVHSGINRMGEATSIHPTYLLTDLQIHG